MTNKLFYGDNLEVLRSEIADESVDLIYLDPPFNSNANYNVLFKSRTGEGSDAQVEAFEDTWHWNDKAEDAFDQVIHSGNSAAAELLRAMRGFLGENDMMAYLAMMAVRLMELHRVLKPTGSLYLHCDTTASHYLKLLLDSVFGPENWLNEIVWRRTGSHNNAKRFGPIHDVIHFYRKSAAYKHRPVFRPYLKGHVDSYFKKSDARGRYWTNSIHGAGLRNGESGKPWKGYDPTAAKRHWAVPSELVTAFGIDPELPQHDKLDALAELGLIDFPPIESGALPTYRQYLDRSPGMLLQDVWSYQPHTRGSLHGSDEGIDEDVRWLTAQGDSERLGYPTQKPLGLLERIIAASSNESDVVLDPFCGCGTAVHAAQKFGRQWIGIDVTHLAIHLIEKRLKDAFPGIQYEVHGTPKDLASAQDLARRDKHQFELWALAQVDAVPWRGGRKGADTGIDGIIYFKPDGKRTEKAIVEVKGGGTGVKDIGRLAQVMAREKAEMAVLVTAEMPTSAMIKDAAAVGRFEDEWGPDLSAPADPDARRDVPGQEAGYPVRRSVEHQAGEARGHGKTGAADLSGITKSILLLGASVFATSLPAKAPKDAWTVTRNTDPITGVSSCVVAAPDQISKWKYTRVGYLYPIVENNSKLGLLVGVSSGGPYRLPTGDILWRVDGSPFRTLKAADNPPSAPMFEMQVPYKTGNPEVDARTATAMASATRMTAALTSTSTVASGPAAYELLKEMISGRTLIYRQAAVAPQYGLPSSNTYAVGQITIEGLRPVPLDASFRRGLQQCSIALPK